MARSQARRLIARYQLHDSLPVQLWKLEDLFPVRYEDIGNTLGVVFPPLHGWPASSSNRARILINSQLGDDDARLVIAHEIGHALCHHVGQISSQAFGMEDKHERQAWECAAHLLIPERVVIEEREVGRIAAVCNVPPWLVEAWL